MHGCMHEEMLGFFRASWYGRVTFFLALRLYSFYFVSAENTVFAL